MEGKRRRCTICRKLTHNWEIVNCGPVRCWDCGRKIREAEKQEDHPAEKRRLKEKKEKKYLIFYEKLDGIINSMTIERMTISELKKQIKKGNVGDVAIVDGILLRHFSNDLDDFADL